MEASKHFPGGASNIQDRRQSVRSRIAGCLAAGGTSVTVTSLTDFIAFIVGYWCVLVPVDSTRPCLHVIFCFESAHVA
jgi:uncharacterized membrane protein